ncbi:polyprenyl synthetase family protein [Nocardioides sp. IC4_145]|uniref:polyprenyl synthetase family protein n=1 Tax=Nocardioides sp. IC4_145 TaxID=2714037 RepID=UPI00140AFD3C|nr:polyprenyl synthetase family protein [Nocardioides sp. IC4_145]
MTATGRPDAPTGDWVRRALDEQLAPPPDTVPGSDESALQAALTCATVGGKQFRPHLVENVHRLLGGRRPDAVPPVAAALELLHTAFVVHDDVIDGDDTRRGRPSAPGTFRAHAQRAGASPEAADAYALAGAVLTGDLALAGAVRAVATAPAPPVTVGRLLDLLDCALRISAAGELADVRFSMGLAEPSLADVLTMEEHKTAVYSFELPLQYGAVLADADDAVVTGLGRVGRQLGLAYQLLDDVQGVFGDPARTGKSELGDLREGKRTPLVVHARTTSAWPVVRRHLGDPDLTPAAAAEIRRALEAGGSRAFVEDLAAGYVDAATAQTAELGLPAELVAWVGDMSETLTRGAA